jgi:hypothetical protein
LRPRRIGVADVLLLAGLALSLHGTVTAAGAATGDNVHRSGANCGLCHTADAELLSAHRDAAAAALVPNLEAVCNGCHADEGASHRTGMPPKHPVPVALPLAPDGTVTCATCHFLHGEQTNTESFERIDNRHGQLCLTCHELSELK